VEELETKMNITIDIQGYLEASFCEVYTENNGAVKNNTARPLSDERSKEILEALQKGDMVMGLASKQVFELDNFSKPICGVDFEVGDMDYTFEEEETSLDEVVSVSGYSSL